jgi:hypothetical protein
MAKKRKAKKKVARQTKKRAAPARKRKVSTKRRAAKRPARKAKPARRQAKTKLPPRKAAPSSPRPMTAPGPAVTPIALRPSPFPSSMPSDFPPAPDGKS